ncbi:MAG TPA: YqzE family protein [Bacillales bacterium]|nr:YqzE family protein [Bacillales bacterium]
MSSNDLIRFITEQMVSHLNRPRKERREMRRERKITRPPIANRWFGLLPAAMAYFFRSLLKR